MTASLVDIPKLSDASGGKRICFWLLKLLKQERKEKRENEEKVGISSRELTPSSSLEDQSLGNSARKFY